MKAKTLIVLMLIAPLLSFSQSGDDGGYSLEECISYALENNERLQISELEKSKANAQVGEIRSQGLPQANINSGINYNFEPQKSLLDPSSFPGADPNGPQEDIEISFQQKYDGNIALGVNQLIFDGSYFVGLQAARTFRELSTKEKIKSEIDVVEAVSKAYYMVLINRERLALLEKNYQRLDTLLYETQQMQKNGFAEKIDVDRIRVNYNNLKVQKSQLSKVSDLSLKLLKFQMGMDINEPIALTEDLQAVDLEMPVIPEEEVDYSRRIEFSQLMTNQNLAILDMKNNRVQYLPKLYAGFNYGYNTAASASGDLFDGDRWLNFGSVGVTLSIPVFDGLYKNYKIQQNKLQIDQLELQKSQLQKNIDIQVEQAKIDLNTNLDMLEVSKENMGLADNIFEITQLKFQEGVGSNLEVIEAEASLKEAQTNYYNALYEAIIAKIELQKALGILYK